MVFAQFPIWRYGAAGPANTVRLFMFPKLRYERQMKKWLGIHWHFIFVAFSGGLTALWSNQSLC